MRARGHDHLPTFGVGKETARAEWQAILRQMLGLDLIRPDPERHGGLRITPAAHPVLRGERPVTMRRDLIRAARPTTVIRTQVDDEDAPLLSALKAKRRALAEAQRVPAYVIFPDRTLIEMAQTRPATLDEMARIGGVGAKKLESYGAAFLEVVTGAAPALHPARRALAGKGAGALYDRLAVAMRRLERGADGTGKYLSCTAATLGQIARTRPASRAALGRIAGMGEQKLDRFADAFLAEIAEG